MSKSPLRDSIRETFVAFGSADSLQRSPTLAEQVTEKIREKITKGQYKVGETLPSEQELGIGFGVSRSVIREALSRLKADGLVGSRQGRGVFVAAANNPNFQIVEAASANARSLRHILELRMGIEVEAAGLAASNGKEADLAALRKELQEMVDAVERHDIDQLVRADLRFHRQICLASTNNYFVSFFDFLEPHLREATHQTRQRSSRTSSRLADAQREHEMIYYAISKRNPEAARAAARLHILNTLDRAASDSAPTEEQT